MKSFIKVKFQVEGIHRWKDCHLEAVDYLRYYHRHIFFFEVELTVTDRDREIEFIILKKELTTLTESLFSAPVDLSCENIAKVIYDYLVSKYGEQRHYKVIVYEDNENGGGVESE